MLIKKKRINLFKIIKKTTALFLAASVVSLFWLYTHKLIVAFDALESKVETIIDRLDAIDSRLDGFVRNSEKPLTAIENHMTDKQIASAEEVATTVYEYILKNELKPCSDQDYAAFRCKEMNAIFSAASFAIEDSKTSISLSAQELSTLQNYMINTALPYNYSSKEFADEDYRESTALYVLPYKVQYVYKDADDTEYSILIDYNNNIFLANGKGRVKVEFDFVRTVVLSTVYRMQNDSRVRFHDSNISFHEGNEKCSKLPDKYSTKYAELDELTERIYSYSIYPSIDDTFVFEVSASELIALYNFMLDTPSMNYSSALMSKQFKDGWLTIWDEYLYTSSSDDILWIGIEFTDKNANLYLSNRFDSREIPSLKVILDSSSTETKYQNVILSAIDTSVRPPEKPYYASYSDVNITWRPEQTENIASAKQLIDNMENFVRNNSLVITRRQDYTSYASSDMQEIWDKLYRQTLASPEKEEIKLSSKELSTLQYYMTNVALPESAGVPENPGEPITSVMDLNIGYTYNDGNGVAFDITILFDRELYLSCKGSNFIHVVT